LELFLGSFFVDLLLLALVELLPVATSLGDDGTSGTSSLLVLPPPKESLVVDDAAPIGDNSTILVFDTSDSTDAVALIMRKRFVEYQCLRMAMPSISGSVLKHWDPETVSNAFAALR
jgi:hypothetical protein